MRRKEREMRRLLLLLCLSLIVVSLCGIQIRDIIVNKDDEGNPNGSFRVRFIHPIGTEETFYWFFSYEDKRVSDYFQSSTPVHTTGFFENKFIWSDVIPEGEEMNVTVKFGKEEDQEDAEKKQGYYIEKECDDYDVDEEME